MEQSDVFSRKIRWLAIAVGLSAAALSCFLSPVAAVVPALLLLGLHCNQVSLILESGS